MTSAPRWLDKWTVQYAVPPAYAPAALQICITAFPLGVLSGLVLPSVVRSMYTAAWADPTATTRTGWWTFPQLHMYLLAWSLFHLLEFTVTASYNPTRLFSDSFLLNNGAQYHIAHLVALVEFAVTAAVWPQYKAPGWTTVLGLALLVFGQVMRSGAMIHAAGNFSHIIADKKRTDHQLVTTGMYSWTRHPSYVGFFYWALGTQLLLGNMIATLGFALALHRFFSRRIRIEEKYLVDFFGPRYVDYQRTVGTKLPLIR